jgi:hypothetical protein
VATSVSLWPHVVDCLSEDARLVSIDAQYRQNAPVQTYYGCGLQGRLQTCARAAGMKRSTSERKKAERSGQALHPPRAHITSYVRPKTFQNYISILYQHERRSMRAVPSASSVLLLLSMLTCACTFVVSSIIWCKNARKKLRAHRFITIDYTQKKTWR